jgi:hypothetical protein
LADVANSAVPFVALQSNHVATTQLALLGMFRYVAKKRDVGSLPAKYGNNAVQSRIRPWSAWKR